ncbi:hypothetical protein SSIN_0964 [Streptococcus sinensis]|uniref:Uncharacterized protein n=1 Tax=Streptococcus sinensis TaxID=176090 RepID=A0A0A0DGK1_9STRE|nr:hypothetical protein SSIN_0964 [Streptococcus sinensis]
MGVSIKKQVLMFKKSLADAVENIATFNQDVADSSIICMIAVQNQQ